MLWVYSYSKGTMLSTCCCEYIVIAKVLMFCLTSTLILRCHVYNNPCVINTLHYTIANLKSCPNLLFIPQAIMVVGIINHFQCLLNYIALSYLTVRISFWHSIANVISDLYISISLYESVRLFDIISHTSYHKPFW